MASIMTAMVLLIVLIVLDQMILLVRAREVKRTVQMVKTMIVMEMLTVMIPIA